MVKTTKQKQIAVLTLVVCISTINSALAGTGLQGIAAGQTELQSYLDPISNLMLAIGALVGVVGGVQVYIKMNSGDPESGKHIMQWFGACIFLVLVSIIIKAFFT